MNELDRIKAEMFDPQEKVFLQMFQAEWQTQVEQLYYSQVQMHIGNRIRPRLVYRGYRAGTSENVTEHLDVPIKIAIVIELIHKASILSGQ